MPSRPSRCRCCGAYPPPITEEDREAGEITCFVCGEVRPVVAERDKLLALARSIELKEQLKGMIR